MACVFSIANEEKAARFYQLHFGDSRASTRNAHSTKITLRKTTFNTEKRRSKYGRHIGTNITYIYN